MSDRMLKINKLIAQQLGQLILSELELPQGAVVTITKVQTSADLHHARVFLSILPESLEREAMSVLINHAGELRKLLNDKVILRTIPKLNFQIDETEKKAVDIDKLLDSLEY